MSARLARGHAATGDTLDAASWGAVLVIAFDLLLRRRYRNVHYVLAAATLTCCPTTARTAIS